MAEEIKESVIDGKKNSDKQVHSHSLYRGALVSLA